MTTAPTTRRPRAIDCPDCGRPMHLARCGVAEHLRTRTPRERADGRCSGRVYIHAATGGMDCPATRTTNERNRSND